MSCSSVRGGFPVHELFWFCLVQVSTTQFCSFPPVLTASVGDGTDVPTSPLPASSSNLGSSNASTPDLEETGIRPSTTEEKINDMFLQFVQFPQLLQSVFRFENCVQTLSHCKMLNKWLAASQPELPRWKQFQLPSQAVRARQALGIYLDKVVAPQPLGPLGPIARGLLTTTGTQDADLILSQAIMMNMHEVP